MKPHDFISIPTIAMNDIIGIHSTYIHSYMIQLMSITCTRIHRVMSLFHSMLLMTLLSTTSATIHYVIPDNSTTNSSYHTLQYYLNHAFTSHTQLHLLRGHHYLHSNLIIHNVTNISLTGVGKVIIECRATGIMISNVTQFTMQYISLLYCNGNDRRYRHDNTRGNPHTAAGLHLYFCGSINIVNLSMTISIGAIGLQVTNNNEHTKLVNVRVMVNYTQSYDYSLPTTNTTGIILQHYDNPISVDAYILVNKYVYKGVGYAIKALLTQSLYSVSIIVMNTVFSDQRNTTILYYYGVSSFGAGIWTRLAFLNCMIKGNKNHKNSLLLIILENTMGFDSRGDNMNNHLIKLLHCKLVNNINDMSLIQIVPANTLSTNFQVQIISCRFFNNIAKMIIEVRNRVNILWQMSYKIIFDNTIFEFNQNSGGRNGLLSLVNGLVIFNDNIVIDNNLYYDSLIELHISTLHIYGSCEITENYYVKYIARRSHESYFLFQHHSELNITNNIIFRPLITTIFNIGREQKKICYFQFASHTGNTVDQKAKKSNYKISFTNNMLTDPLYNSETIELIDDDCTWLSNTAFVTNNPTDVLSRIIINEMNEMNDHESPSTVCVCLEHYDCDKRTLGPAYMGVTLKLNFRVTSNLNISPTLQVVNNNDLLIDSCKINNQNELSQTHSQHGCNEYTYTVSSNNLSASYCKLYLRSEQHIEAFYIRLLPCPMGFVSRTNDNGCQCDPLLQTDLLFVKSCNINNATVQRPSNSWISYGHRQHNLSVSPNCPFDYCIPHSSYINMQYPDTQCQYNRTGILCGYCPEGLSSVLGSSRCKHCSNIHLLIILPLAMSGCILVVALFIFNLTITNSNISSIILYANIVGMNNLVFFPQHHSVVFVLISLLNINLGIETCFYNNMSGYDKSWLQLVFPSHLFALVILLVIASRYSIRVQRLTARRVLPVLATLLLLCYTNILQAVCMVLFFYSKITHLPSKNTTLVWSVATDVQLFGYKFVLLFTTCLIIFLVLLLPFNIVLLFSRKLSYFKMINYFKPLIDAYHGPYKDNFYYWTGLQLLIRITIFGLSVLDNKISFLSISVLLAVFFCIHGMSSPYISKFRNIQEALVLLNLLAVHATAFYNSTFGGQSTKIIEFLILIVLIYSAIILIYQCMKLLFNMDQIRKYKTFTIVYNYFDWKKWKLFQKYRFSQCKVKHDLNSIPPNVSYNFQNFQEPLLALTEYK